MYSFLVVCSSVSIVDSVCVIYSADVVYTVGVVYSACIVIVLAKCTVVVYSVVYSVDL